MKKNKSVIVLISVILILAIVGIFAYLYLATDIFRSDKELFAKYFGQNEIIVEKLANLKVIDSYKNLENENKYESNIDINVKHSEGGNISNPLNDLNVKVDIQKDNEYHYANARLLYKEAEYVQAEFIKEQDIYGVRFADAFQQFITLEKDENFNEILTDIGLTDDQIQNLMQLFDTQTNNYNKEQILSLKNKYVNLIKTKIENGEFSKQKDVNITFNENTINANTYTVLINSQQTQNMLIEMLESIEINEQYDYLENKINELIDYISDEVEIPAIKITVYEYKKNLIKTVFEIGTNNSITIENQESETRIIYLSGNSVLPEIEVTIRKTNNEIEERIEINANLVINEEEVLITFANVIESSTQIKIDTEIGYKQGIKSITLDIENNINVGENIEKSETLVEQNMKSINSIKSENRKDVIYKLKDLIILKMNERINLLFEKAGIYDEEDENSLTQVEINKFNAKFEFYTGDEVSSENVKTLLEIVKNNMNSYENLNEEDSEEISNSKTENNKLNIKINIEKDKENQENIDDILEKINSNEKYKVSIKYNEINELIESITITEI